MLADDVGYGLLANGEQVQPGQHGPESVLFADVVGTGTKAFLAAEGNLAVVEEVAEELPAGRRFIAADTQCLGHTVSGLAGGHGAGDPLETGPIGGQEMEVGGQHGEAVAGRDEEVIAHDHVAVAVAVRGRAEGRRAGGVHAFGQFMSMDQVGIGMAAAKVFPGNRVHHRIRTRTETLDQNALRIRTGNGMHGIEADRETAGLQR